MPTRPDRNLSIERLLREGHTARTGAAGGLCVTPEELAAWVDGGLPADETARVEAHLASCAACQALLAAFASTEPAGATLPSRGLTRALLPLAAAAVVVVGVWLAGTRSGEQPPAAQPAERQMARLDETPPAPTAQPPTPSAAPQGVAQQSKTLARPDADRMPPPALLRESRDESAAQERSAASAGPAPAPEVGAVAAAPPVVAAPPAAADAAPEVDPARRQAEATARSARARAEGFATAGNAQLASAQAKAATATWVPLASPDGASRWRISGTAFETSADSGATWLPALGVTPTDLAGVTSGASPARGVCWLVGRDGLVLVAVDGRRFTRAAPPAQVVLTGVEAVDGAIAEVRAADGRTWRTTNAGRTWMPVR